MVWDDGIVTTFMLLVDSFIRLYIKLHRQWAPIPVSAVGQPFSKWTPQGLPGESSTK